MSQNDPVLTLFCFFSDFFGPMGPAGTIDLAAQCKIPPHITQYLFEIVAQRGYCTHFALFSCGMAQVSLRYPSCTGGITPQVRLLSKGERLRKGGGRYRTRVVMLRHQKPHSAQQEVSRIAEIVSQHRAIQGH